MIRKDVYIDCDGREISLQKLDQQERRLIQRLIHRAMTHPVWVDFRNYWVKEIADFYDARGFSRKQSSQTVAFKIAQDLSGELAVTSGHARHSDYRDELEDLIQDRFKTRRSFCKATGLAEDMLSHFFSGRKELSLGSLSNALERIGYALHIAPVPKPRFTGKSKKRLVKRRAAAS